MYRTSLPATDESPNVAGVWARGIALTVQPSLADDAERLARELVTTAIRRTPSYEQIDVEMTADQQELHILVRDPTPLEPIGSREWAEVSKITLSFGTSSGPEGHEAWAVIRPQVATVAAR